MRHNPFSFTGIPSEQDGAVAILAWLILSRADFLVLLTPRCWGPRSRLYSVASPLPLARLTMPELTVSLPFFTPSVFAAAPASAALDSLERLTPDQSLSLLSSRLTTFAPHDFAFDRLQVETGRPLNNRITCCCSKFK